jgi:hypothetical protein
MLIPLFLVVYGYLSWRMRLANWFIRNNIVIKTKVKNLDGTYECAIKLN